MKAVVAAGGTGGHIFPALAVARELRRRHPDVSLLWIGTTRNREKEVCEKNDIPVQFLDVSGMPRKLSLSALRAAGRFTREVLRLRKQFTHDKPDAVVAFGGYVCAPVLAAASMAGIPYFLQEQNTVPGVVNKFFSAGARNVFLGLPLYGKHRLKGTCMVTGTPVRQALSGGYQTFTYPEKLDRSKKTVLICGGSQGAQSMNRLLRGAVKRLLDNKVQVIWQTGSASYREIQDEVGGRDNAFVFESLNDPYPYYAVANVVVGRAGASTLAEIAYFGLPCVLVPLPWAAENHQWTNAGLAEHGKWGVRIAQDDTTGDAVYAAVSGIINDPAKAEQMSKRALDSTPAGAAAEIVKQIMRHMRK